MTGHSVDETGRKSMTRVNSPRGRVLAVLLAAAFSAFTVFAALHARPASADNPTLTGDFCTLAGGSTLCMTLTSNGVAYGTPNRAALRLKPGTYTLTVNDTS